MKARFLPLLLLLVLGCSDEKAAPRHSVILISIDTLRADALGCYGYERDPSPVLDAFAAESVRFETTIVQSAATPSSHAAMLTSQSPAILKRGARFPENEQDLDPETASYGFGLIDGLTPTIQSRLHEAGFRTAAFTAHEAWLGEKNGFHTGFDHFETGYPDAPENIARVEKYLSSDDSRPLFLFIHFYDVHSDFENLPYRSPAPFFGRYSSWYTGDFDGSGGDGLHSSRLLQAMHKGQERFEEEETRYVRDLYDEGVAFMDEQMGRLFDLLRRNGLYDESLVIVTADHGEEFQEHGGLLHYQHYDEVLKVPLLIRFPGGAHGGTVVRSQVRCVDISQTVLAHQDLPPLPSSQGVSLLRLVQESAEGLPSSGGIPPSFTYDGRKVAYRTDSYKVLGLWKEKGHLFDLKADPREQNDLSGVQVELFEKLSARLLDLVVKGLERGEKLADLRSKAGQEIKQFSEDDLRILEELGYTDK
ncbi:MAG: sulfatase [Planctomycetota bacterium]